LRTPEDMPIPQNTLAEIRRDMARLAMLREQIKAIEQARQRHLEQAPQDGPHVMVLLLARIIGVGVETADMLVREILSKNLRDEPFGWRRSRGPIRRGYGLTRGERLPLRRAQDGARRDWLNPATPACAAA
jgi:transposase